MAHGGCPHSSFFPLTARGAPECTPRLDGVMVHIHVETRELPCGETRMRDRSGCGHYPGAMPDIFGVIADATRRDILQVLLERLKRDTEISVSEIVGQLEISQPTVSKHLKVLREAELVTVREEGQHRFYSLNPEPLEMVEDFVIPFLSAGFDTEVTVEYLTESGERVPGPEDVDGFADHGEVLPEEAAAAAERMGRAAARAENRVKELVARFRLRD